jgi:hypothetical protein
MTFKLVKTKLLKCFKSQTPKLNIKYISYGLYMDCDRTSYGTLAQGRNFR